MITVTCLEPGCGFTPQYHTDQGDLAHWAMLAHRQVRGHACEMSTPAEPAKPQSVLRVAAPGGSMERSGS